MIEVSSYQIDLAPTLDPSVGILINITEDHLDRHGTLRHYAAVKERLVAGVQESGTAIVGVDDNWCAAAADRIERAGKRLLRVSVRRPLPDGVYVEAERIMHASGGNARVIAQIGGIGSLRGRSQRPERRLRRRRGAGARAVRASIQQGLRSFPGLAHRMEQVGRKGRVLFVNDSKATNADSAAQALACFTDIFWIAGGKPKSGGIGSLAGFFPRIRKAYLIGEAARRLLRRARGQGRPCRGRRRWNAPPSWRRTMPRRPKCPTRWCCFRPPAPRSTSIGISRCAATGSGNWCSTCRASSGDRNERDERPGLATGASIRSGEAARAPASRSDACPIRPMT